jgi:hypothetical protein
MRRLAALVILQALASAARGDGGFIPLSGRAAGEGLTTSAAQKAVIIRDGPYEILLLQTTYAGPAAGFAWIIPVPSRPAPDDIFVASTDFLKGAFLTAQPVGDTFLTDPWSLKLGLSAGMPGKAAADRVTVWAEVLVGDYRAAVLSAGEGAALQQWLQGHGYATPADLGPVADEYARKGWSFVALKMNLERVPGQAVLRDVEPLGLRFKAERLVFPLRISTLSAPERTALLLVVYAEGTVQPRELPTVTLPKETDLAHGESYYALVRRTLQSRGGRAMLVEMRQPDLRDTKAEGRKLVKAGLRTDLQLGQYRQDPSGASVARWPILGVTRLFGLLPRDAMVDLTFEPGPEVKTSTHVRRHGALRYPAWAEALWRGWPQLAIMLPLMAWAYRRRRAALASAPPDSPLAERLTEPWPVIPDALVPLLLLLAVPAGLVLLAMPFAVWPLLLPVVVLWLVGWVTRSSPHRQFWAWWITALVVMVLCLPSALAHTVGSATLSPRITQQLGDNLKALDEALQTFTNTYHCYPARVSDLTLAQPTQGLDASGNPVAITTQGMPGPILDKLPLDPLTGRRDTWVYDVLSPGMVDSGGYKVTVSYSSWTPH